MGWLDCNPDEIYLRSTFVLRDAPEYLPGPAADFVVALGSITPRFLSRALDSLLILSFTARPMQVCAPAAVRGSPRELRKAQML
jgi:hypothetical protein